MKVRFYSIQDLYDEVKDLRERRDAGFVQEVVRMQFLTQSYTSEFKGGGTTTNTPVKEEILTLTVARGKDIFYYSKSYFRCIAYDYEAKRNENEIDGRVEKLKNQVKETFKGWNIKKGVYEQR